MPYTALVTGANRGIGLEIARDLAMEGYRVLLGCRDPDKGKQAADSLTGDVTPVALDLSNAQRLTQQLKELSDQFSQVDVLVNNAGVLVEGDLLSVSAEGFLHTMQVNALSVFTLLQHFTPAMSEKGYGRIVNLSSGWGSFNEGLAGPAAYSISKATLNALTVSLASQLSGDVKVNAMCPGWVRTEMGGPEATSSPEEGADTAIWLATLPASGANGGFFRRRKEISW